MTINILKSCGAFAENKETARKIRKEQILPAIKKGQEVIIDFQGVEGATQSFVHVLIREVIKQEGLDTLDLLNFRNCNENIQIIISIVVEYVQDSMASADQPA